MLLYNGHSGEHYSLTYAKGKVDINGDSYNGNSLIYIPTESEMESMRWADDSSMEKFNDYIKADKYLIPKLLDVARYGQCSDSSVCQDRGVSSN